MFDYKFKWTNGWGYTPCTAEYYYLAEALRFMDTHSSTFDLLVKERQQLDTDGHAGNPVRYQQQDKEFVFVIKSVLMMKTAKKTAKKTKMQSNL